MAPRRTDTRKQILERARELLQTRGLEGFSYRDISTHLGIKNAAVHYHFPTKNDLVVALVEEFTDEVEKDINAARERNVPPPRQLDVYFERSSREVDDDWKICAFGAVAASYETLPEEVQAALHRLRKSLHGWLHDVLESGRTAGQFQFTGDANAKAAQIATAMQGARQMSKIMGHNIARDVADQYRRELYVAEESTA